MHVEDKPPSITTTLSLPARLFYSSLYGVLWLQHYVRNKCRRLWTRMKNSIHRVLGNTTNSTKQLQLQRHVAMSGAVARYPADIVSFVMLVLSMGTEHVTIYDPVDEIDVDAIAGCLREADDGLTCDLTEIGVNETRTRYLCCTNEQQGKHRSEDREFCLSEEKTNNDPTLRLTIVRPGTGRSAVARSARKLAETLTPDSAEVTAEHVTEWLDKDDARCMLPSEPDVVVVFPPPAGPVMPVLGEFPVWQLRLTQIRFSESPITMLSPDSFLEMIATAASAPKRFGT